jgi:ABC-2 type transport system ATP-binding protein
MTARVRTRKRPRLLRGCLGWNVAVAVVTLIINLYKNWQGLVWQALAAFPEQAIVIAIMPQKTPISDPLSSRPRSSRPVSAAAGLEKAPAIQVVGLVKAFGAVTAVNGIDFTVPAGQTVALLGGNGAGKTTTISMLLGLLQPTAGTIRLFGEDLAHRRHHLLPRMNFSSPYVELPHRLTVRQNLEVFARLYGLLDRAERVRTVINELELSGFADRRVGTLSAGQKTRVALAKAMLNLPELLLLDEPTASLDPDTADWIRAYLETYQARHDAAILLASHNMSEVERLADHVLMMRQGRIVDAGAPEDLVERYSRQNLEEVFLDIARDRRTDMRQIDGHGESDVLNRTPPLDREM